MTEGIAPHSTPTTNYKRHGTTKCCHFCSYEIPGNSKNIDNSKKTLLQFIGGTGIFNTLWFGA